MSSAPFCKTAYIEILFSVIIDKNRFYEYNNYGDECVSKDYVIVK